MQTLLRQIQAAVLGAAIAASAAADDLRVTFPKLDVDAQLVSAGCSVVFFDDLAEVLKEPLGASYVPYDAQALMAADIGPYYVYHHRYCEPMQSVLGANTFVMVHLELASGVTAEAGCDEGPVNLEAKVYSFLTGEEARLLRWERIDLRTARDRLLAQKDELLATIRATAGLTRSEPAGRKSDAGR